MGYAPPATSSDQRCRLHTQQVWSQIWGDCLLSFRRAFAAFAAQSESFSTTAREHRALTRIAIAVGALAAVIAVSSGGDHTKAGPPPPSLGAASILPEVLAAGATTDASIPVTFAQPMDRASVEAGIQIHPHVDTALAWSEDGRTLFIRADTRWQTDTRYLLVVPESARTAVGTALGAPLRFSFTTQTAATVIDFEVAFAGVDDAAAVKLARSTSDPLVAFEVVDNGPASLAPTELAPGVSAGTEVRIGFSAEMDRAETEGAFAITPRVAGELRWYGNDLVFQPSERLEPGSRYTVSLVGARDALGNPLGGKANFSFTVRDGAQVVRVRPRHGEVDVSADRIEIWFSQPMQSAATEEAFTLRDVTAGAVVAGELSWNARGSVLVFTPLSALAAGHRFEVRLGDAARDEDGNPVSASASFTTLPPAEPAVASDVEQAAPQPAAQSVLGVAATPTSAPLAVPAAAPAPAGDLIQYALNQINSARAAYGRAPLYLDGTMSAVAAAHAWDQVQFGYYSHASRDGSGPAQRQAAAGVGFSSIGENQCHHYAMGAASTLEWCHAQFMSEPCCVEWNHIANILDPRWTRVGIGIGDNGSHVVITWDFAN
jgi:uncharacterized protein YkwD